MAHPTFFPSLPRVGQGLPLASQVRQKTADWRGQERFHTMEQGVLGHPTGTRGGFQPSPRDVEGPRMHLTQSRPTRGLQGRPLPKAMVAVTMMRHTIPALQGMAESGGDWRHLPTFRGPDHPDPKAVKPPPPGVFKPPRQDALGNWKGVGGQGAQHAPRTTAPTSTTSHCIPARSHAHGPQHGWPVMHRGLQREPLYSQHNSQVSPAHSAS